MTEQTNTPELRFPGFNNEWQCNILDNCCYKISDGIHSTPIYSKSGDFSFINGNNLINGKIHFENAKLVDSKEALKHKRNLTYNETILLSINGTIGNIALYRGEKIILGKSTAYINIKANFLSPFFLYYFLETNSLQRYFRSELTGTTIKNLSIKSIKKTKLYVPNITEQRKIGDFFNKLDQQIELEEKKLELLEQQKRGYMQKIFSQELRFKDKHGNEYPNWQTVKIGSILKERRERGDGEMLSVTINHGIVKFDEIERKDNSSKDKSNYKKVYKNDIAYNSMRMWQGASGKSEFNGIVSPAYTVVTPIENINSSFIAYYFKTHNMIHKFRINSQGLTSDTWNLKYKQLKDIKISICSKEEQDKIANLLTILDIRIKKQNHKLEILNINKKGLLQKMFV